jgi:hypothetical protein
VFEFQERAVTIGLESHGHGGRHALDRPSATQQARWFNIENFTFDDAKVWARVELKRWPTVGAKSFGMSQVDSAAGSVSACQTADTGCE